MERKLYTKLSKCDFWKEEVKFLAHVVSRGGITKDLAKVEVVTEWGQPTSVIEERSFLGLAGYYQRFIKEFSQNALPITKLTRKDTPFVWTSEWKANVVVDALSIKSLSVAWMIIKEEELQRKLVDLNLGVREVAGNVCLNQLHISRNFKAEIQKVQQGDQELQKIMQGIR
ncbi:uncharacterized mitochondrial protein AtMg00860-like [Arachis stenosperma]|uniref:uncharacterized mitochondrial protein AtMg00860-like n=1 Tax=Arachis stenosperma TaxID=217475 RepID=UPI0025AC2E41|nr:uncharacterized mitochondrial protein AtMg00860-like [Arachis stenosperma]